MGDEEQKRQEEALKKFAKLKAERAKREGKNKSVDSDDDSLSDDEGLMSSIVNNPEERESRLDEMSAGKNTSSLLRSSSESDIGFKSRQSKKKRKVRSGGSSGEEKVRSFKAKRSVVDSSDDASHSDTKKLSGDNKTSKIGLDTSDSDQNHSGNQKTRQTIYSESDSEEEEGRDKSKLNTAKNIKTDPDGIDVKNTVDMAENRIDVKQEQLNSDSEFEMKNMMNGVFNKKDIKREIKVEKESNKDFRKNLNDDKSFVKDKRKPTFKKDKKRDKEMKENIKEKSILGQKLKMAKIFGTSSEDESSARAGKPPTPNTSATKHSSAPISAKGAKLNI